MHLLRVFRHSIIDATTPCAWTREIEDCASRALLVSRKCSSFRVIRRQYVVSYQVWESGEWRELLLGVIAWQIHISQHRVLCDEGGVVSSSAPSIQRTNSNKVHGEMKYQWDMHPLKQNHNYKSLIIITHRTSRRTRQVQGTFQMLKIDGSPISLLDVRYVFDGSVITQKTHTSPTPNSSRLG